MTEAVAPPADTRRPRGGRRVRPNAVRIAGGVAYLALTDWRGQVRAEAVVDVADLPRVRSVRWHLDPARGYVLGNRYVGGGRCVTVRLHRVLLGLVWEARLRKFRARCGQSRDGRRQTLHFGAFPTLDEARRAAAAGRRRVMPFTVEDDEATA